MNFALDKNCCPQTDSKEKGTLCRWHMQRQRAVMNSDQKQRMMENEAPEIQAMPTGGIWTVSLEVERDYWVLKGDRHSHIFTVRSLCCEVCAIRRRLT